MKCRLTVKEYAEKKGETIENIINLLHSNGFNGAVDPDYVLSESSLRYIDPIFYNELKYKRDKNAVLDTDVNQLKEEEVITTLKETKTIADFSELPRLLTEDFQNHQKTSIQTPKKQKRKKSIYQLIGFVKFFDTYKGFGVIITNDKGLNIDKQQKEVVGVFFHKNQWNSEQEPKEKDLVVFTPKKTGKVNFKYEAIDVEKLTDSKKHLLAAFDYRGQYADIKGFDKKKDFYDENILKYIFQKREIQKVDGNVVVNAFAEYLLSYEENERQDVIQDFLSSDLTIQSLMIYFPDMKGFESNQKELQTIISQFVLDIEACIFNNRDIDFLKLLPENFDFTSYQDKVLDILIVATSNGKMQVVKEWLQQHKQITENILQEKKVLSLDFIKILYDITKDFSLFYHCEWEKINGWIENKEEIDKISFFVEYFKNREVKYIEKCNLSDELVQLFLKPRVLNQLLKYSENCHGLLSVLLDIAIKNDLAVIDKYILKGFNIKHVYPELVVLLETKIRTKEKEVRRFLQNFINLKLSLDDIFLTQKASDIMLLELFIVTNNYQYIEKLENPGNVIHWLNKQDAEYVLIFFKNCLQIKNDILQVILTHIDETLFVAAIKDIDIQQKYEILKLYPEDEMINIILKNFAETSLLEQYCDEEWENLKSEVKYVVFDLETDGKEIKEFAYKTNEEIVTYVGEENLNSLFLKFQAVDIVIGHNIKQWDLKVLERKGNSVNTLIWDTLEMELLLNPCQDSYALRTQHNAYDDTNLVDKLFWNQIIRLSQEEQLCLSLKDFLPIQIIKILEKIKVMNIQEYLIKKSKKDSFYQAVQDIDRETLQSLKTIAKHKEKVLVIAPLRLWKKIAQHIMVSFIDMEDIQSQDNYTLLSKALLLNEPIQDVFLQNVLLRFMEKSKTPIIANLPTYLYLNSFKLEDFRKYFDHSIGGNIHCVDVSFIIKNENVMNLYEYVYTIDCELESRLNNYQLSDTLSPSDFWSMGSLLPIRFGGAHYIAINAEDKQLPVFSDLPNHIANVWLERTKNGLYHVNYNYNYVSLLDKLKTKLKIKDISWHNQNIEEINISLVYSKREGKEYYKNRVLSTSRYRSIYWLYQFILINNIYLKESKPIIYIIQDATEIDAVIQYARELKFYVPAGGTLLRKMELIAHSVKGLIIIDYTQFFDAVSWNLENTYCFVWDEMAVDKYRMMWKNFNLIELNDAENNSSDTDAYQTTLKSLLDIYQYYSSFVQNQNENSVIYIIDPYLEEYYDMHDEWNCHLYAADNFWFDKNEYDKSLEISQKYFRHGEHQQLFDVDIPQAMDVILNTLVKSKKVPNPQWSDIQAQIIPNILEKKENFLISLPTGSGKSVLFQGPALYNSVYTQKLSIVITPLKALMQDQVHELEEKGFYSNVDYLSSDKTYAEIKCIYRKIISGELALLYVTPERFRSRSFVNALSTRINMDKGLEYIIFDEAHCISQWGMEFRPEYLYAVEQCKQYSQSTNICIVMLSATVTDMIYQQINDIVTVKRLGQENDKKLYNPIRSHIAMYSQKLETHEQSLRIEQIVQYIREKNIDIQRSRMLIFCKTRRECEELSQLLANENIFNSQYNSSDHIGYFHAGMNSDERQETYQKFRNENDPLFILCATKSFGMGMDIPNIHYIIHYSPPNVLEDYLQEVGRAGRNEEMYKAVGFNKDNPISAVCLYSDQDFRKARELQLKNSLNWSSLEKIRKSIIDYIKSIQDLERTQEKAVVVPSTLWASSQTDYDFNDFTLGRYWLEKMGRIKTKFYALAHIVLELKKHDSNKTQTLSRSKEGEKLLKVLQQLKKISDEKRSLIIQVNISQLAHCLAMRHSQLMNLLLKAAKLDLLTIKQTVRCRISNSRSSETEYLINYPDYKYALHIIVEAVRRILKNTSIYTETIFTHQQIENFIDFSLCKDLIVEVERNNDNKQKKEKVMKWQIDENKGNTEKYRKDLFNKRKKQIFVLLEIIPSVKLKSYIDVDDQRVKQSIRLNKKDGQGYLDEFEKDCLSLLEYIYHLNADKIDWCEVILALGLEEKGFNYFYDLIRYLHGMGYIAVDSLLPMGIEIFTTPDSETEIADDISKDSSDYPYFSDFNNTLQLRDLRLYVMRALLEKVANDKNKQKELISGYFNCVNADGLIELLGHYYEDNDDIWEEIRQKAMDEAEEKLRQNQEQWNIYNTNSDINVNVEAGPGSGKTHILTMKCAKLIFRGGVNPKQILVLAYNRAVVEELKTRLSKLFISLGLSRSASQLYIFTFHGLAKFICQDKLENYDMKEWEDIFLDMLKNNPRVLLRKMPEIRYIFIDEFQDITQVRLDAMLMFNEIYPNIAFFTIGDKDQSIYGFEKKESMDPNHYYDQLYEKLKPIKMKMTTNYRSYPEILLVADSVFPKKENVIKPCEKCIEQVNLIKQWKPNLEHVYIYKLDDYKKWDEQLESFVKFFQNTYNLNVNSSIIDRINTDDKRIKDIAIFFRTNDDVYRGYSLIREKKIQNVNIRIQGATSIELYRSREIYVVLKYLEKWKNTYITLQTESKLKKIIKKWMDDHAKWDHYLLDFAFTLIVDYINIVFENGETCNYGDIAEYIRGLLLEDNSQMYKIYNKYKDRRILEYQDAELSIILTTIHKVKGLEFDAVIVTPSNSDLPFDPLGQLCAKKQQEAIDEEKRLLYVAYTRAKKFLIAYQYEREQAIFNDRTYSNDSVSQLIREKNTKLDCYNIGFNAGYNFAQYEYILNEVAKNDTVQIQREVVYSNGKNFVFYNILHQDKKVGQLSRNSTLVEQMEKFNITRLQQDLFVSDVVYWTYEETCELDLKKGLNYASGWCQNAKDKGGVFIVTIAGYVKIS